MSARQAEQLREVARQYDAHAERFPVESMGRIANRIEAAKYHDLAARAESWPDAKGASELSNPDVKNG